MPAVIRKGVDFSKGHGCFPPRPADSGSPNVITNNSETVRAEPENDTGGFQPGGCGTYDHYPAHCCGNPCHDGCAEEGSPDVFVNDQAIHRDGDAISCGDIADNGSLNVFANQYWDTVDIEGDLIRQSEFDEVVSSNQTNPELPDEIVFNTVQQEGECTEGYLARAGNPSGQLENGLPPTNKIANIEIPSNCDLKVDTQMILTEGSPTEPTPPIVEWSWTPIPPGLTMDGLGHITGTLKEAGVYDVTITVTNGGSPNNVLDEKVFKISAATCDAKSTVTFIHPLPGSVLTSGVNPARSINGGPPRPHRGCDFAYGDHHLGNVHAAAGGVVLFAGVKSGYGNVICIGHRNEKSEQICVTLYAHLSSYSVNKGQSVSQGDIIAVEGNTGIGTGAHLHFEIRGPNYLSLGNSLLNQSATVYDPMVYINGTVEIDTGIVAQAYNTSSDIDSGAPTTSTRAVVNNNALSTGVMTTPCRKYETVPTQDVTGLDPTANATGPATTPSTSTCSGPTPNKQDVIAAINVVLDGHPELDTEDRKFILFVARVESNYNNYAKNPSSSATGLYQFLTSLANAYGLFTCEDRCDITLSTEAMISFYQNEILNYYTGWESSGKTTIAGGSITPTTHSARYPQLSKTVWCYGLIHHDGVGNAQKGRDKQGVEYAERKLQEYNLV